MEGRCGRTVLPTTRCNYITARCRHKPIIPHLLQRVVERSYSTLSYLQRVVV